MKRLITIAIFLGCAMPFLASASDLARAVQEKPPRHELILQLLNQGANPNIMIGTTPLIIYVTMQLARKKTVDEEKWKEILKTILKRKVSVDETDTQDYTALMYASFYGHSDAVTLLLAHGANANFDNDHHKSPVSLAYEGLSGAATEKQKKQYAQIIALLTNYPGRRR